MKFGFAIYRVPSCFKIITICILGILLLTACKPPFRAMSGYKSHEIGYSVVKVQDDIYHVGYQAFDNYSYEELSKALIRYVSELCLSSYKLDEIYENEIRFGAWDSQIRPRNSRAVTSLLHCDSVNEKLYENSYGDVLWFLLDGLVEKP